MIKIIATDMDHTLLDDNSSMPLDFGEVLELSHRRNINFVLASGRTLVSIKKKAAEYINDVFFVSDNGAIVEYNNEILYISQLSEKDIELIVETFRFCKETSIIASGIHQAFVELYSDEHRNFLTEYYPDYIIVDDITQIDVPLVKITSCSLTHSQSNFDKIVNPTLNPSYNAVTAGVAWIDVMHANVNKGNGLKHLLSITETDPSELVAFGDFHNDIQMLELAGKSYAVSNAHEDVKKIADEIIGSNNDNAVMKTVRNLLKK